MKLFVCKMLLTLVLFASVSCSEEVDGFPREVTFPKEGGTVRITGAYPVARFGINGPSDQAGVLEEGDDGVIVVTCDWLSGYVTEGGALVLTAEPSTSSKERELTVDVDLAPDMATIKVRQ